jgi:hypothetical protein
VASFADEALFLCDMVRPRLLGSFFASFFEQSFFSLAHGLIVAYSKNPNPSPRGLLRFQAEPLPNDTITDTVLNETKVVDGVETRVVEDRETRNGQLIELTRDYYAIDSVTKDVYYMGEDVDVYKNGKVTGHEGAWLSGVKGAQFGLMMPGAPKPGQKFYQERAPGVGMDRCEIVSVQDRVVTPAGTFEKCIHVHETSPLEKGSGEHKWYSTGVGPVKDAEMLLVRYGMK